MLVSRRISSLSWLVGTALLWKLRWHFELAGLLRVLWRCIELARGWCKWWLLELSRELLGILWKLMRVLAICIDRRLCSEGHTHAHGWSSAGGPCFVPVP